MERWENRVAVVTGASSGIGEAVVKDLLKAKLIVYGLARRIDFMEKYRAEDLSVEQQQCFHPVRCDVSSAESVDTAFDQIIKEAGGVDVLVNNAGTVTTGQLSTMPVADVLSTLQVNVMGVVYCTQRAFKSMKERNFDGHILIVNSTLGHRIPLFTNGPPRLNIYPPSKHALTAITEMYRQEFKGLDTKIRITDVSPGLTDTPVVPDAFKINTPILKAEDVAHCIRFAISAPQHVQIHEIKLQATGV